MQGLSFSIIIIPLIAISLDILLYFVLLQKATPKELFKQYVLTLIVLAFLLNVVWEILQIPLYNGGTYSWSHILFCVLASVADVIMVFLIYFGFAVLYKDALWIQNLNLIRVVFLILTGGIGAVLAEMRHLSIATWSYADAMPVIPILNAGLSPVLQFMILPLVICILAFKITKRYLFRSPQVSGAYNP